MPDIFGFQILRKKDESEQKQNVTSFAPRPSDDGALEVIPFGAAASVIDLEGTSKTEGELVSRYRDMATQQECDSAVEDIVNELIVEDDEQESVAIKLDNIDIPKPIKAKVETEFKEILKLLDFKNKGYDIVRRWYVDGRLYHHLMINKEKPKDGIQELRYIDPRKIKKIREVGRERKDMQTGETIHTQTPVEYYMYSPRGIGSQEKGVKIAKDAICHVHSGILDARSKFVLSHMHKAIKPLNQLRMLEDATVIYRLTRAPERRIFYIDVGNLPKAKAEQHLREMMVRHKNRLTYDITTGEVKDERRFMTMTEDYWLPRREGGRGTEITNLPGGQNLGEMEDVDYFRRKLYKSLNVPVSRLETEATFNMGRSSEITRDELKFAKFINRLRKRFSMLFDELLKIQLSLKNIMTIEDWEKVSPYVYYDFLKDNHFTELKNSEIMKERLAVLADADQYAGKYFSKEWIWKNVLYMDDEDIKEMKKQIEQEGKDAEDEGAGIFGPGPVAPTGPGAPIAPPEEQPPAAPSPQDDAANRPVEQTQGELDKVLAEALKVSFGLTDEANT